ncbi:MAG TPA: hypothetical protein VF576_00155, partial [Rubricoccaceae bacterium]
MRPSSLRSGLALAALLAAPVASAQSYQGTLAQGDATLTSGEFTDSYEVQARRGQSVTATLTSSDFDTYVIVKSATDEQADNDDCTQGDTGRSCATFTADQDGTVRVIVTSYAPGETGRYALQVVVGSGGASAPGQASPGAGWGSDRGSERGGASAGALR